MALVLIGTAAAEEIPPEPGTGTLARTPAVASTDMVVAANPLAAEAGARILRAGGGAIDAAIATQMVLNLVEPQSSGIGGGAFLLYYDAVSGVVTSYDGREVAPAAVAAEVLLTGDNMTAEDAQAVGFVNRVVAAEEVLDTAMALATMIAGNAPLAVRAAREVLRKSTDLTQAEALALETEGWPDDAHRRRRRRTARLHGETTACVQGTLGLLGTMVTGRGGGIARGVGDVVPNGGG